MCSGRRAEPLCASVPLAVVDLQAEGEKCCPFGFSECGADGDSWRRGLLPLMEHKEMEKRHMLCVYTLHVDTVL